MGHLSGFRSYSGDKSSTMELIDNIEIEGAQPTGIAVSPYDSRVYVTFSETGEVGIFNPQEMELISSIHVGAIPAASPLLPVGLKLMWSTTRSRLYM